MNAKQKKYFRIRMIKKMKYTSRNGPKRGYIKCWKGTTLKHFITMCEVAHKLINDGWEVYSEVEFNSGGRADLLAIKEGLANIIEVMDSETEERLSEKRDLYPSDIPLVSIKVNDFDLDTFEL